MIKTYAEKKIAVKGDVSELKNIIFDSLKKLGIPLILNLKVASYHGLKLPTPPVEEIYKSINKEFFVKDDDIIYVEFNPEEKTLTYGYIGSSMDFKLLNSLSKILKTIIKGKGLEMEEITHEPELFLFNPIEPPQYSEGLKASIKELSDPEVYNFLRRLKEFDKAVYLKDLEKIYPISQDRLQELIKLGLILRDYLIICKMTGREILRFSSLEAVKEAEKSGFKCSLCGNPLSEERVEEAIFLPAEIKELLKDNKWMLSIMIDKLVNEIGIPKERIFTDNPESYLNLIVLLPIDNLLISILPDNFSNQDAYMLEAYMGAYSSKTLIAFSNRPVLKLVRTYLQSKGIDVYPLTSLDKFNDTFKRVLIDKLIKFLEDKFRGELEHVKINLWEIFKQKLLQKSSGKSPRPVTK